MDITALIEKVPDADFLMEMMEVSLNRLMQSKVESVTGAAQGERLAASAIALVIPPCTSSAVRPTSRIASLERD